MWPNDVRDWGGLEIFPWWALVHPEPYFIQSSIYCMCMLPTAVLGFNNKKQNKYFQSCRNVDIYIDRNRSCLSEKSFDVPSVWNDFLHPWFLLMFGLRWRQRHISQLVERGLWRSIYSLQWRAQGGLRPVDSDLNISFIYSLYDLFI